MLCIEFDTLLVTWFLKERGYEIEIKPILLPYYDNMINFCFSNYTSYMHEFGSTFYKYI